MARSSRLRHHVGIGASFAVAEAAPANGGRRFHSIRAAFDMLLGRAPNVARLRMAEISMRRLVYVARRSASSGSGSAPTRQKCAAAYRKRDIVIARVQHQCQSHFAA